MFITLRGGVEKLVLVGQEPSGGAAEGLGLQGGGALKLGGGGQLLAYMGARECLWYSGRLQGRRGPNTAPSTTRNCACVGQNCGRRS